MAVSDEVISKPEGFLIVATRGVQIIEAPHRVWDDSDRGSP
jgi:hypothetical protein